MTAVIIVSIVFSAIVLILAIISATILASMRLRRQGGSEKDKQRRNEDTRMIQEMHNELTRMEARVEALETILMDHFGKDPS